MTVQLQSLGDLFNYWKDKSITEILDATANRFPEKEAVILHDRRVTYQDLSNDVDIIARAFNHLGVRSGDKVGVLLGNCPEWIALQFATSKLGAIMVPLNTRYRTHDLGYVLANCEATTLVITDRFLKIDFISIINALIPELKHSCPGRLHSRTFPFLRNIVCLSRHEYDGMYQFTSLMHSINEDKGEELNNRMSNVVSLLYTSGTTGSPKGVMISNTQLIGQACANMEVFHFLENDRFLIPVPFFTIFGLNFGIILPVIVGGCVVTIEAFDPVECLRLVETEKCTHITGSPTMYLDMLDCKSGKFYDTGSLRTGMTGAGQAPEHMIKDVKKSLGIQVFCNGYGMTETAGAVTMTLGSDSPDVIASTVGKPLRGVQVRIVDPISGSEVRRGGIGEICIAGWPVMEGYYKTNCDSRCLDTDHFLHTGDLGCFDADGYLKISGRLKEMYISGGANVYPVEIENFLFTHEKIERVAVVGVPDVRLGEVGFAFILLKQGEIATKEELVAYCRPRIANYKIPKYMKFVSHLPLTGSGKIIKFQLAEEAARELQMANARGTSGVGDR